MNSFWIYLPLPSLSLIRFLKLMAFPVSLCLCLVFLTCPKELNFSYLLKFKNVPDVIPSSSAVDWCVHCSVDDVRTIFLEHFVFRCIDAFCYVFVQGPRFTPVCGSWRYACSIIS